MKQQLISQQGAARSPTPAPHRRLLQSHPLSLMKAAFALVLFGVGGQAHSLSGYVGAPGLNSGQPLTVVILPVDQAQTPQTGVSLVAFPGETAVTKMKFYCDQRFDAADTALACAQQPNDQLAVQVPSGPGIIVEGDELNTQVPFMTAGAVTTFSTQVQVGTETVSVRGSLICETGGDGSGNNFCVKIIDAPPPSVPSIPAPGSGPAITTTTTSGVLSLPKFIIDNNSAECGEDLLKMQAFSGPSAEVDWTSNRLPGDPNNLNDLVHKQLRINICTPSTVEFVASPSIASPLANVSEIKQVARSMAFTPLKCTYSGKTYTYATPPVYKCP
ncbi:hypothetical protein [Methyloterricola oryzae]|uniref:hypothetical protein n=1 Tax=Methyloterricola oryzae TaxID=1495050 RepID=UPI0005EB80DF|nr:hypothetical protein [Methyloterricola oryzae]